MKDQQVITIGGKKVDIGHLFAGLDAAKHPTSIQLAGGLVKMRSNQEATTFIGDVGSVVVEYLHRHGKTTSFYDIARKRSPALEQYYDGTSGYISKEDMAGNADSYALEFLPNETICDALNRYYSSSYAKRYATFASKIDLNNPKSKTALQEQVFNSALAYAAGTGHRGDVLLVLKDPRLGLSIGAPTFWEAYWNISGWVVEIFVSRVNKEIP
jgi:hypothetical protein